MLEVSQKTYGRVLDNLRMWAATYLDGEYEDAGLTEPEVRESLEGALQDAEDVLATLTRAGAIDSPVVKVKPEPAFLVVVLAVLWEDKTWEVGHVVAADWHEVTTRVEEYRTWRQAAAPEGKALFDVQVMEVHGEG